MTHEPVAVTWKDLLRRSWGIFSSPQATFDTLKQSINKADYIIPLVLILAVALGSRAVVLPLAYDQRLEALHQNSELADDEKAMIIERMDT